MSELVRLEDARFWYPGQTRPAVVSANLVLRRGERLLITGPSGSGKSSLLLLMAGLVPETVLGRQSGTIIRSVQKAALVLQNPEAQIVTPTVEEEIAFPLENSGMPRAHMRERVGRLLAAFGLEPLRERNALELSGGECQRVSLAAAMAGEPDVLFLDEPTSYLDGQAAQSFFTALAGLPATVTVVMIEHHTRLAAEFCSRFVRIGSDGRLRELGRSELLGEAGLADLIRAIPGAADPDPPGTEIPPGHTVLELRGLAHRYPGAPGPVLHDVNFRLQAGEIAALMGPSGSGKSTLLGKIARFLPVETDSVLIEGQDSARLDKQTLYRHVMYVPQNPEHFFLADSVDQELMLAGGEAARGLAREFGLAGLGQAHPFRLSEGEKRRLTLAVALAARRRLYLFDEPCYGLDRPNAALVAKIFRRLRRDGAAILLVTHDEEFAGLVADRLVRLDRGSLKEVAPNECVSLPA